MKTADITRKHREICRIEREREERSERERSRHRAERERDLVLISSFTAWWVFFTVALILTGGA